MGDAPQVDLTQDDFQDTRLEAQRALGEVLDDVQDALKDGKEGVYVNLCKAAMKLSQSKSGASIERVAALEGQLDIAVYNGERQRGRKRWARRDTNVCIQHVIKEHGVESATKMMIKVKAAQRVHKRRMLQDLPPGDARDAFTQMMDEELAEEEDDMDGYGQHIDSLLRNLAEAQRRREAAASPQEAEQGSGQASAQACAEDSVRILDAIASTPLDSAESGEGSESE